MKNIILFLLICFIQIIVGVPTTKKDSTSKSNEEITQEVNAIRQNAYAHEKEAKTKHLHRDAWQRHYDKSTSCFGYCLAGLCVRLNNSAGNRSKNAQNRLELKAKALEQTKTNRS